MKTKRKRKLALLVMLGILTLLLVLCVVTLFLPKPLNVANSKFNLTEIDDGIYQGECENGLVFAKLEVEVQNHEIVDVRILKHRNGLGSDAEAIVDSVISGQSIEVDAVSGATMSSKTILKAIEEALSNQE